MKHLKYLLFIASTILLTSLYSAQATVLVPTHVYFPSYSTYINFNNQQVFDTIYQDSSYWYFNGYGFQVQNANLTVTNFFVGNRLGFTVNGVGTSTTRIYCGSEGEPISVTGASSWDYNGELRVLTVMVTHSSPQQIEIVWNPEQLAVITLLRGNYYLVFVLISIVPIIVGATMVVGLVKGKDTITVKDIYALTSTVVGIVLAYIIIISVMNAIIGG